MDSPKQEVFLFPEDSGKDKIIYNEERVDSLIDFAKKYLKKPYCSANKAPKCFDCSGFVQYCFRHFGKELPHSSNSSAYLGKFVSKERAMKGDLIFFTGSNSETETVGHIGIITGTDNEHVYFIHASVQSGIIISDSEETYYKKRFMMIKRIPF